MPIGESSFDWQFYLYSTTRLFVESGHSPQYPTKYCFGSCINLKSIYFPVKYVLREKSDSEFEITVY